MEYKKFERPFDKERICGSNRNKNKFKSSAVAFIILGIGILLLLKNMGILPDSAADVIFTWQMLLVAIGFINLFGRSFLFGVLLMLTGGFFLGAEFWFPNYEIGNLFFPLILIFAGLFILFMSLGYFRKKRFSMSNSDENFIEEVSVFGGTEKTFSSKTFKGGRLIGVFGGSKIDLRDTQMEDGTKVIEVVMIFGGTTIIIPPDWNVKSDVFNLFGGFSDKRRTSQVNPNKTLNIKGVVLFGGGELRN